MVRLGLDWYFYYECTWFGWLDGGTKKKLKKRVLMKFKKN